MLVELLVALMSGISEAQIEAIGGWQCSNQVEVWCSVDKCTARSGEDITPMSILVDEDDAISVCAYTGCWEGKIAPIVTPRHLIWTILNTGFSTMQGAEGVGTDVTLLINKDDGIGFVRAGGIATPVLCDRR